MVIMFARVEAGRVGAKSIDTEHLLLGVIRADPITIQAIAPRLTLDVVRERATAWHAPASRLPNSVDMPLSDDAKRTFDQSETLAEAHGSTLVRTEHLLLALATTSDCHAAAYLEDVGAGVNRLRDIVSHLTGSEQQSGIDWSQEDLSDLGI